MSSSSFGPFRKLFAGRSKGDARAVSEPKPHGARADDEHGPVEDWFIRTAKILLGPLKGASAGKDRQSSPLQQKIAALEAENAQLRADAQRLADEVISLRTLIYVRGKQRSA